jgi:hypothetical protein
VRSIVLCPISLAPQTLSLRFSGLMTSR